MKRQTLAIAALALVLSATACSSKQVEETTAAPTTEAAATVAETETVEDTEEEEVEEEALTGSITAVDGDLVTVQNSDDGTEKQYDISQAEVIHTFPLTAGDQIYLTFAADTTEDPVPAIYFEVEVSVIAENTDPYAEGTIKDASMNNITMEIDGETYTLSTANAYIVAGDGLTVGKTATVTYIGDLDDDAMAVKVVTEDQYDTDEAEINAFIGDVVQMEENNIVLESAEGDFYTFVSDDIDFNDYKAGQTLQISYEGSITAKEVPALEVTEK